MRLLSLLAVVLIFTACQPQKQYIKSEGLIFGTIYHITYEHHEDVSAGITQKLNAFDWSMSTYKDTSVISKINRNESADTDVYFRNVFNKAKEITAVTEGAFDMTVAPLVNAWGFGFSKKDSITPELIDALLMDVGMDAISLVDQQVVKEREGIMLDGSAIAKGYAVDVVADYLQALGIENFMVEIGGEMRVEGKNTKGTFWKVGIDKPIDDPEVLQRDLQEIISVSDIALATSGNYRNFYMKDGKKYAHTISPFTGYPVDHQLLGVSVLASDCMSADAYATAFMVLGVEKSMQIVEADANLEAYFISAGENGEDYKIEMSAGFGKVISQ
ncbi:FAD:protein FMN transferase [Carboxylicivirga sp. N1Y90]|uniref:FAD:protein FMN transferase n=1 Tax=Carboxylicivirga fragile TaxID=3417571 RepID=UPI003D337F8E|nr:FAD:protein FMN transferase [Marinilabiliaceae bacterium N1Y90]